MFSENCVKFDIVNNLSLDIREFDFYTAIAIETENFRVKSGQQNR